VQAPPAGQGPAGRGLLIAVEGTGGAGKSTLARRLAGWLEGAGHPVVAIHEPGATGLGAQLRRLLLGRAPEPVPWAEAFLFAADRAQTYAELVVPALRAGKVVVSDRSLYSTIAYQVYGRGLDLDLVDALNRAATGGVSPDLVFVLDLDPLVGLHRKHGQHAEDRFDEEGLAFQQRVRDGYLFAARRDAGRACVLDAARPPEALFEQAREVVAARLAHRARQPANV
jgi:dTMP kinase